VRVAVVATASVLLAAAPAWAHPRLAPPLVVADVALPASTAAAAAAPAESMPAPGAPALALIAALLVATLVVVLAATLAGRRRALAVTLALLGVVLVAETGVHSVHHLDDAQGAAACAIAQATAQVDATIDPPAAADGLGVDAPGAPVTAGALEQPGTRPLRPDVGRAPPAA
jgi:hypothetical protein